MTVHLGGERLVETVNHPRRVLCTRDIHRHNPLQAKSFEEGARTHPLHVTSSRLTRDLRVGCRQGARLSAQITKPAITIGKRGIHLKDAETHYGRLVIHYTSTEPSQLAASRAAEARTRAPPSAVHAELSEHGHVGELEDLSRNRPSI